MPPLNHRTDLTRSDTIYEVQIQDRDPEEERHYTSETHYVETLSAALQAASEDVPGDTHGFRRMSLGLVFLWEEHEEGEEHTRASIHEHQVYTD